MIAAMSVADPAAATFFLLVIIVFAGPAYSSTDTFVYGGCSQLKFAPGTPYEANVNSILTSLVNSATLTTYNHFTSQGSSSADTVYGLFQCRGDILPGDCSRCVAAAVARVGSLCLDSCGGALQLEGCFVRYDNVSFLGVEDKTVVVRKCGAQVGFDSDVLNRRDAVMASLAASGGGAYRVGAAGNAQALAQCTGDLSPGECQDCLEEAIARAKEECGPSMWADMYLAKCFVRYSVGWSHSRSAGDDNGSSSNDDEVEKTLAIIIGLIAGVTLLIVFLSLIARACERGRGGK